jgi:hypothetical protein
LLGARDTSMTAIAIQNGTYDDDLHIYRDLSGKYVPSITQVLKFTGLSSYSAAISKEVMENASKRGTIVHQAAWAFAKYGDVDPSWLTDETEPYFAAYRKFLYETGFQPDPEFVESPMIACVHGMAFGCTPDVLGSRGKFPHVVELKTVSVIQRAWRFQTAAQELARFNTKQCGRAVRMAVQLLKNGKYKIDKHEQHQYDCHVFISALSVVHDRLANGEKLWCAES